MLMESSYYEYYVIGQNLHTEVKTLSQVYTWGCNDEGALGRATPEEDDCMVPGKVTLEEPIVQISSGDSHTAALTRKGAVFAWGTFRVRISSAHCISQIMIIVMLIVSLQYFAVYQGQQ